MLCKEPPNGLSPHRDSQDFAMWDAAYVKVHCPLPSGAN